MGAHLTAHRIPLLRFQSRRYAHRAHELECGRQRPLITDRRRGEAGIGEHLARLCFKVSGKTLPDLWSLPISDLLPFVSHLKDEISSLPADATLDLVVTEIESRLGYLDQVGLGYLTLDRATRTLSGGEVERVNLTTCLGAALTGTLFVLDEPTVGLHPRDIDRLDRKSVV